MRVRLIAAVALALLLTCDGAALGSDLYTLTAMSTSGPPVTVTASGSNLLNLVQNAVSAKAEFQALKGQDATYALSYAGQKDVITMTRNAAGTSATLTIPSTGFSKTFTGTNAEAIRGSISEFLRTNAEDAIGRLNQKLQQRSKVAVVDGNPHATTATMADDAFYRFGLPRASARAGSGFWLDVDGGTYHAGGINSDYANVDFGFDVPFGERADLSIGVDGGYNRIGRANSYTFAGLDVGLPITVVKTPLLDGFLWKVTPFGYGTVTVSPDTLTGGGVYGCGAASSLNYMTGPWTFTLGNQISYFAGADLGLGGRVYGNRHLDQWITKNGLKVAYMPAQHLFLDAGVTYTHFLNSAAVPDYVSPIVGIGWRFNPTTQIRVGGRGDFVNGYTSVGGEVSLNVSY